MEDSECSPPRKKPGSYRRCPAISTAVFDDHFDVPATTIGPILSPSTSSHHGINYPYNGRRKPPLQLIDPIDINHHMSTGADSDITLCHTYSGESNSVILSESGFAPYTLLQDDVGKLFVMYPNGTIHAAQRLTCQAVRQVPSPASSCRRRQAPLKLPTPSSSTHDLIADWVHSTPGELHSRYSQCDAISLKRAPSRLSHGHHA